jgi:hypothetical protein
MCLALVTTAMLALPATPAWSSGIALAAAGASANLAQPPASAAGRGAIEQALQAVARASAEARQSASAAASAAARVAALELAMDQLRQEAQHSQAEAEALREKMERAESTSSIWLLGVLAAGLALLAAWLTWRLSTTGHAGPPPAVSLSDPMEPRPSTAEEATDRPPTAAMAFRHAEVDASPLKTARTRSAPAWPPPAPADATRTHSNSRAEFRPHQAESSMAVTAGPSLPESSQVENPEWPGVEGDPAGREVTIDELLDLEQQADFFVVLGQDDAAIDLLVEHLRRSGGGSPLAYLKLLEIHRRRANRDDYERTLARFNRRFDADVPGWEDDLHAGRTLSDYPGLILRLQQVWPRPLDSMAELEALMLRNSQGPLFDLPAYREILFLYTLARDLLDRESAATGRVDLLLPLPDGSEFSATSPSPFLEVGRGANRSSADCADWPTAPVDLDLSFDGVRTTSIFDPLGESATRQRPRS